MRSKQTGLAEIFGSQETAELTESLEKFRLLHKTLLLELRHRLPDDLKRQISDELISTRMKMILVRSRMENQ